jgi:ribosomal protein S18 acetylase RimI-like enzyme
MKKQVNKDVSLHPASDADLAFARELTRVNMRDYYSQCGLIWQPEGFDAQWPLRENYLILKADTCAGYLGVTRESSYLYVRDVQLIERYRGEGVGGRVMGRVTEMAIEQRCACVRLKVFKTNPAVHWYKRLGFVSVGEEQALLWMERVISV